VIIRPGSLVAGTVTKYMLLVFNIAAGAVLMPFTVAHLGRSQYGLWMLVASMTTYFQLLDIGYGNGVVRHLVEADARNDVDEVNCIASTFVVVYTIIGVVALLLTGGLIIWLTAAAYMVGVLFLGWNRQVRDEHRMKFKTYRQLLTPLLDRQPLTPAAALSLPIAAEEEVRTTDDVRKSSRAR